jgi:hypothetical protein
MKSLQKRCFSTIKSELLIRRCDLMYKRLMVSVSAPLTLVVFIADHSQKDVEKTTINHYFLIIFACLEIFN